MNDDEDKKIMGWPSNILLGILLAVVVWAPSGCASKTARPVQVSAEAVEPPPRAQPAESMVECRKPGQLEDGSFGAVVRKLSEAIGLLDECASKQKHLSDWISSEEK